MGEIVSLDRIRQRRGELKTLDSLEAAKLPIVLELAAPDLAAAARRGERVRVWVVDTDDGSIAYALAQHLQCLLFDIAHHDLKILATQSDEFRLAHARRGTYRTLPLPLDRAVDAPFAPVRSAEGWCVSPETAALVSFKRLALEASWPMKGRFDLIWRLAPYGATAGASAPLPSRMIELVADLGWLVGLGEYCNPPSGFDAVELGMWRRQAGELALGAPVNPGPEMQSYVHRSEA